MGQEESHMVDDSTPPETLKARTVEAIADYIKSGRVRKIVVMTGAGISTSAGIPDFRSPETGLYANLARLDLPYAEAVFDISYFRRNPLPFYALAHELYPGKYRPTIAHSFVRLLQDKGLLLKLFTQNIDCLEREAGVEDTKIVEAHGSFARQRCIDCKTYYPKDLMLKNVREQTVPHCVKTDCSGLVKPDIVFFGEQLPEEFFNNRHLPGFADLCLVMGTSLSVQPFASLPQFAREGVPRALINKEIVGGLGSRADDVLMLGDCDDGVRRLAEALGWREELEALWALTAPEEAAAEKEKSRENEKKSRDDLFREQLDQLTADVDASLKLSEEHTAWVKNGLRKEDEKVVATGVKEDGEWEDVSEQAATATEKPPLVTEDAAPELPTKRTGAEEHTKATAENEDAKKEDEKEDDGVKQDDQKGDSAADITSTSQDPKSFL